MGRATLCNTMLHSLVVIAIVTSASCSLKPVPSALKLCGGHAVRFVRRLGHLLLRLLLDPGGSLNCDIPTNHAAISAEYSSTQPITPPYVQ
eukprot:742491-Prorocentrum_minimum.AAC.2